MATSWIRARQTGRANRMLPGEIETRAGSWHRLADAKAGVTACGKLIAESCANPQRRSSRPVDGFVCETCGGAS